MFENKTMNKLHSFKSNSIKKLKQIMKYLDFKKIIKAKYNLSVIIIVVIIVSICTNVAWSKRGSINYFLKEAKQKIILFADFKKPVISAVNVSDISEYNAKITWKTSKLTKTKFYLGTDTDYTLWQESFNRLSYDHWLNKIPSLEPGTTYHFKIVAIDKRGNKTEYDDYIFDTLGDRAISTATSSDDELINNRNVNNSDVSLVESMDDIKKITKKADKIKDSSNADTADENINSQTIQSIAEHVITTGNTYDADLTDIHNAQAYMQRQPSKLSIGLCTDISCPACQYCYEGGCINRLEGYDDCSGCQRCVNGSCQDYDSICSSCQHCDSNTCIRYCLETDISCGCKKCINCDDSDGWINLGSPYSCCDGSKNCTCQKQKFRDYSCSGTACVYAVSETRINKNSCTDCGSYKICIGGVCKDIYSTLLYPATTIGAFVHQLSFNFFNNSSQAITVIKVEFFNKDNKLVHNISAEDIIKTWKSNSIKSGGSVSGNFSFQISHSVEEIEGWHIKWYCVNFYGDTFVVSSLD